MRAFVRRLTQKPRTVWLWRANFQLHLWIGLFLTLYLIVIGVTGSILVFANELGRLSEHSPKADLRQPRPEFEHVLHNIQMAYPGRHILSILVPTIDEPFFVTTVQGRGKRMSVRSDPSTGEVAGERIRTRNWIDFIRDLHVYLLFGIKGRITNGVGGALLLLINITGLIIWWPGIKLWKRGLTIDFRRTWRRLNFDIHRAVGFWAISIISMWGLSGIYFAWPRQVFNFIDSISPLVSAKPPAVVITPTDSAKMLDLPAMVASAQLLDPGTTLIGVNFPYSRHAPFEILMRRAGGVGREYTDTLYFSPWDGSHLKTWRYGVNESLGDWLIWLQVPLHFGTYWGLGVKILWCFLGLTVPLLAITGVVLYWNRFLRHKIR